MEFVRFHCKFMKTRTYSVNKEEFDKDCAKR